MRQTDLHLAHKDRELIAEYRNRGVRHAREANRAHILAALDGDVPEAQIMAVLGIGRATIWRTRAAYLQGGATHALRDCPRPGKPRQYDTDVEAKVTALACSQPPPGACRWTLESLSKAVQSQPGVGGISRETVRRMLKKTASNPGAS